MGAKIVRALIMGAAPCSEWGFLRAYLELRGPWAVFCADGGMDNAAAAGLTPDYLVGDWDSGGRPSADIPCLTLPAEKDLTDLEAAVDRAAPQGAEELLLCGCTGGRLDHTAANLTLLEHIAALGCAGMLVDSGNEVRLLGDGETLELDNTPAYRYLSLVPLDRRVEGVTLEGVKYPLSGAVLTRGSTLSVSNEPAGPRMTLTVGRGRALLIRSQRQ